MTNTYNLSFHQHCALFKLPSSNAEYWENKLSRNISRDQDVWRQLETRGWYVIIVWECQLKRTLLDKTVERVAAEIINNGQDYQRTLEERKQLKERYLREQKARKNREQHILNELRARD